MFVRQTAPHPLLARNVRHYQARSAAIAGAARRIALPARTDVLIEFYFTAPHLLELQATRALERAPSVAAVGPQTHRRVDLILAGQIDSFTIHFTPTGLHALTGVPMSALVDAGIDAAGLFGARAVAELYRRLGDESELPARARIADDFLLTQAAARRKPAVTLVVDQALARIAANAGSASTAVLADAADLSGRQFRRLFEQQVGIAPKRYARIVRLQAAIAAKARAPGRSWADIAHDGGWFDQAHMDKDFRAMAGAAPSHYAADRAAR